MVGSYRKRVTLFPQNEKTTIFHANSNSGRPSHILKACIGGRGKLECYGSLFAIEDELGTTDQYLQISMVSEYPEVFLDVPGLPPLRKIKIYIDLVLRI